LASSLIGAKHAPKRENPVLIVVYLLARFIWICVALNNARIVGANTFLAVVQALTTEYHGLESGQVRLSARNLVGMLN
jgi:hypothetical protein